MKLNNILSFFTCLILITTIFSGISLVKADIGDEVATFNTPGGNPRGLTWDGSYFWHSDASTDIIYKLDHSDCSVISSFSINYDWPADLAWTGSYLWLAVNDGSGDLIKLTTSGDVVASYNSPGQSPTGLTWDGNWLWHCDSFTNTVYKMTESGGYVDSWDISNYCTEPNGLTWDDYSPDGPFLWITDDDANRVYKYDITDFSAPVLEFYYDSWCPSGITTDSNYLWLTDYNGNGKIYQFEMFEADNSPPTPNPSDWDIEPYAIGQNAIEMKAEEASDPSGGIEYYFKETSGNPGGDNSGWQSNPTYIDNGLNPDTQYTYKVKTRDSIGNTGIYSNPKSATTQGGSNDPPYMPSKPNGPDSTSPIIQCQYQTSTTDQNNDDIRYGWDWDDGSSIEWSGYKSSGATCYKLHAWNEPGNYEVRVIAEDEHGDQSGWSEILIVNVEGNIPPNNPNKPNGPESGKTDYSYTYTTKTADPNGDQVKYGWDWDDGSPIEWTGFYNPNQQIEVSHSWNQEGNYNVKVKAKDMFELESEGFSEILTVTIQDPKLQDQIFDYDADISKVKWIHDLAKEPDDFGSNRDVNCPSVRAVVFNQNDFFIPQTNIGEVYIGYEYTVPVIDGEGILHKARLKVDGNYDQYLQIGGFGQAANIKVDLLVEEVESEYMRSKSVYSESLCGWDLDFLLNLDGDEDTYVLEEAGSLDDNGIHWLYMDLKEGYSYKFWLKLTSDITTTGLPGKLISIFTQVPCPDMMGYARSENIVYIDFMKLEWLDTSLSSSSYGVNHRPDIPNTPSCSNVKYRIDDNIDFSTFIDDEDNDNLRYRWYWGDGSVSDWIGPCSSGRTVTTSHTYEKVGTYSIKVETKDTDGVFSGLSQPKSIFINVSQPEGSITITSPSGEDTKWKKGTPYNIRWETQGDVGDYLSIDLVKEKSDGSYDKIRSISVVPSNNNIHSWKPDVEPGSNYQIMVYGTNSLDLSDTILIEKSNSRGVFNLPITNLLKLLFDRLPFLFNFLRMHNAI